MTTYGEASGLPFPDVLNRYQALNDRDMMARAIAILKARGQWTADRHLDSADYPPLTTDEHLELIALGEVLARHYGHPSQVHNAVVAGATWDQIAAATETTPGAARFAYRKWAEGQHRLHADIGLGLGDDEYAAAVKAAKGPDAAPAADDDAEAARRLSAIREVLTHFDWEHDDRQLALEAIERIADGGQQ